MIRLRRAVLRRCLTVPLVLIASGGLAAASSSVHTAVIEQHPFGYYGSDKIWSNKTITVCWNLPPAQFAAYARQRAVVQSAIGTTWNRVSSTQFVGWQSCNGVAPRNGFGLTMNDAPTQVDGKFGHDLNGDINGMNLNVVLQKNWRPQCPGTSSLSDLCTTLDSVHEFGHSLGLYHEQERPDNPNATCDHDGLPAGTGIFGGVEVGAWDLHSIMNYCNPLWTAGADFILSDEDITTIHAMYGDPLPLAVNPASSSAGLIQSTFTARPSGSGNFETVRLEGNSLVHYWRETTNNDFNTAWNRAQVIATDASSNGSLIQGNYGSDDHHNFELVVQSGSKLVHYWHNNTTPSLPWYYGGVVAENVSGPGSLIQTNIGKPGELEAVVPVGGVLTDYLRGANGTWQKSSVIGSGQIGTSGLVWSSFNGGHREDAAVLVGHNLVHYQRLSGFLTLIDNKLPDWVKAETISTNATGPGAMIQSDYDNPGAFEVLVPEGSSIVHYYRLNSKPNSPWIRVGIVSHAATGPAMLMESSFKNLEAVVPEGNALVHYFLLGRQKTAQSWQRVAVVAN